MARRGMLQLQLLLKQGRGAAAPEAAQPGAAAVRLGGEDLRAVRCQEAGVVPVVGLLGLQAHQVLRAHGGPQLAPAEWSGDCVAWPEQQVLSVRQEGM